MWLKVMEAGTEVRMLWGNEQGPFEPYHISRASLASAAGDVRDGLTEVVRKAGNPDPGVPGAALRGLARSGQILHFELFDAIEGPAVPTLVKNELADNGSGASALRITGHPAIHVPWALVFDSNPSAIPHGAHALHDFSGFWGLKYALSSTLSGYSQPRSRLLRKGERSKLLSLIHHGAAQPTYENLSNELKSANAALLKRPVGVAYNLEECGELITEAASYDTIFHFFGHQCNGMLDLGDGHTVKVTEFRWLLDRLTETTEGAQSYGLVLLSACEGAVGNADHTFTNAVHRAGLCGAIGTETVVPRSFAAEFAIRFLTMMLGEGKSVGETMTQLRHEPSLWPLSLVYGCYAHPDYRISVASANPA